MIDEHCAPPGQSALRYVLTYVAGLLMCWCLGFATCWYLIKTGALWPWS